MKVLDRRLRKLESGLVSLRLIEKIQSGELPPKDRQRVLVACVVGTPNLEKSTCQRSLSPDGVLFEYVRFKYDELTGKALSEEEVERWIATFPIEFDPQYPFGRGSPGLVVGQEERTF